MSVPIEAFFVVQRRKGLGSEDRSPSKSPIVAFRQNLQEIPRVKNTYERVCTTRNCAAFAAFFGSFVTFCHVGSVEICRNSVCRSYWR